MQDRLLPQLLGQPALGQDQLRRADLLVELDLARARRLEEDQRLRQAERLVELPLLAIEVRQRAVELDPVRVGLHQVLELLDGVLPARLAHLEVELGQLLTHDRRQLVEALLGGRIEPGAQQPDLLRLRPLQQLQLAS